MNDISRFFAEQAGCAVWGSIVKGPHLGPGITALVLGGHFSAVRGLNMEKWGY